MSELTHIDADGEAHMVDVSSKPVQDREAMARGEISLSKSCLLYTSPSPRDPE